MSSDSEVDLRFIPDYDLRNILSYCSEEQKELVSRLRESVEKLRGPLSAIETRWLSDACLCRYLRARSWNLGKSETMLIDSIDWRRDYKPWGLTTDDVDVELNNPGKLYLGGVDKYARPIIVMKPGKDNTGVEVKDKKVAYLVYLLERAIRVAERNNREKLVLLIDFKDNSQMAGMSQISVAKEVLSILQNHYPERLGACFMVNPPWTFRIFWGIVSPFLDEVTRNKIKILKKTADMLDLIPEDQLEEEYGGQNSYQYNYEEYKRFMDKKFPAETEEEAAAALKGETKPHKKRKGHHGGKKHRHHRSPSAEMKDDDSSDEALERSPRSDKHEVADETDPTTPRDANGLQQDPSSNGLKKKKKRNKKHSKTKSQDLI